MIAPDAEPNTSWSFKYASISAFVRRPVEVFFSSAVTFWSTASLPVTHFRVSILTLEPRAHDPFPVHSHYLHARALHLVNQSLSPHAAIQLAALDSATQERLPSMNP